MAARKRQLDRGKLCIPVGDRLLDFFFFLKFDQLLFTFGCLFVVLCGQLLCFFKDQDDFLSSKAATPPISIYKAQCKKAEDYTKRKHVFR